MRAGTIHKNLPNQLEAIQEREHQRSVDGRRKVNTTFDHHRNYNVRGSREYKAPLQYLPKPESLKPIQYKATHTAEIERMGKKPSNFELPKR